MFFPDTIDHEFERLLAEWRDIFAAATDYDWWDVVVLPLGVLDGYLRGTKAEPFAVAVRQSTDRYHAFTNAGAHPDRQLELENLRRIVEGARRELLDAGGESNADVGAGAEDLAKRAGKKVDELADKAAWGFGLGGALLLGFVIWRLTR